VQVVELSIAFSALKVRTGRNLHDNYNNFFKISSQDEEDDFSKILMSNGAIFDSREIIKNLMNRGTMARVCFSRSEYTLNRSNNFIIVFKIIKSSY
jgi:hypothetical protein